MIVPPIPLPELRTLAAAPWSAPSLAEAWRGTSTDRVFFYSRARWALLDAVRAVAAAAGRKTADVWCPAYFCEEAVAPLRADNHGLNFYPVEGDFSPDWTTIQSLRGNPGAPAILILVHFFGFPNRVQEAKRFCQERGMVLIEDAAHALCPNPSGIGTAGEMTVYSPRKLLAVPDGGLLVLPATSGISGASSLHAAPRNAVALWLLKRLCQTALRRARVPWPALRGPRAWLDGARGETVSAARTEPGRYSRKLLRLFEQRLPRIVCQRRINYQALLAAIEYSKHVRPCFPSFPDGVTPFLFPLRIVRGRNGVLEALRAMGIPAGTWPTLPREVVEDRVPSLARQLRDEVLTLPVHQCLGKRDIKRLAAAVNSALRVHAA